MFNPYTRARADTSKPRPPAKQSAAEMESHPGLRRQTPRYIKKKELTRNIWIASLLLMLLIPLGAKIALGLLTTFVTLIILDETA